MEKGIAGKRLAELRKKLGLIQAEMGQLVGAHTVTVSRWESAHADPSPYQQALLEEFAQAAQKEDFGRTIKNLVIGAGIAAAIYTLLKAAREG